MIDDSAKRSVPTATATAGVGCRHQWCRYSGPSRGDCLHYYGVPNTLDSNTTDGYGIPHGWCDYCWAAYQRDIAIRKLGEVCGPGSSAITFKQAFDMFVRTLSEDKDLFFSYQSNIAMSVYDVMTNAGYSFPELHALVNRGAVEFLNKLIKYK